MAAETHRKLKLGKKFEPLPVDDGDEHFANGIFDFNVTKMLAFIAAQPEKFPVEQVDLSSLIDYGGGDRFGPSPEVRKKTPHFPCEFLAPPQA
jgi:hypothetical protein